MTGEPGSATRRASGRGHDAMGTVPETVIYAVRDGSVAGRSAAQLVADLLGDVLDDLHRQAEAFGADEVGVTWSDEGEVHYRARSTAHLLGAPQITAVGDGRLVVTAVARLVGDGEPVVLARERLVD